MKLVRQTLTKKEYTYRASYEELFCIVLPFIASLLCFTIGYLGLYSNLVTNDYTYTAGQGIIMSMFSVTFFTAGVTTFYCSICYLSDLISNKISSKRKRTQWRT